MTTQSTLGASVYDDALLVRCPKSFSDTVRHAAQSQLRACLPTSDKHPSGTKTRRLRAEGDLIPRKTEYALEAAWRAVRRLRGRAEEPAGLV